MERKSFSRRDLAEFLAKKEDISVFRAESIIRIVIEGIVKLLADNRESGSRHVLNLPHFGSFQIKETKPRRGHNPRTGEPMIIPESFKVLFHPSKDFKEKIREGKCD